MRCVASVDTSNATTVLTRVHGPRRVLPVHDRGHVNRLAIVLRAHEDRIFPAVGIQIAVDEVTVTFDQGATGDTDVARALPKGALILDVRQ